MAKNLADIVGRRPLEDIVKSLKVPVADYTQKPEVASPPGGYRPKAGDEQEFVDKHEVEKTADANGNGDEVFNASNIQHAQQKPGEQRHGYKKPEDKKAYLKPAGKGVTEETELDEVSATFSAGREAYTKTREMKYAARPERNVPLAARIRKAAPQHTYAPPASRTTTEAAELSPKQKKIAKLGGNPEELDAEDFKKLRQKKLKEAAEILMHLSLTEDLDDSMVDDILEKVKTIGKIKSAAPINSAPSKNVDSAAYGV